MELDLWKKPPGNVHISNGNVTPRQKRKDQRPSCERKLIVKEKDVNVAVTENNTNVVANNDNNDAELKSQEFDPHEEFKHENVKVESVDDNVVQAVDDVIN